jgi:hypothetical protein
MIAAIIGSRTFTDYNYFFNKIKHLKFEKIISGGASGADSLAKKFALENKIPFLEIPANWEKFGKSAGFIRNVDIIDQAEVVIAFWDGKSKGTSHSIQLAKKKNKEVLIFRYLEKKLF